MTYESPPARERRPGEDRAAADTSHVNPPGGVTPTLPLRSDNLPSTVLVSLDNLPTTHALLVTTGLRTGGVRRHVYSPAPSAPSRGRHVEASPRRCTWSGSHPSLRR